MSLKDEIERLIQKEQDKLEIRDRADLEFRERQCLRFQVMRGLLQELVDSIEPAYIEATMFDDSAVLRLGRITDL
jgi:hypothetical protein